MQERLEWIRLQPAAWAHWEPVRGGLDAQALLAARYPQSQALLVEADGVRAQAAARHVQPPWWQRWRAQRQRVVQDVPEGAVQMLWANMALHLAPDPQALIAQWHRALAVDGFVMFSCLGPDTLRELRALHAQMGWPAPAHEFTDMHDLGDMLVHSGFAEPVMDMERITLTFETPQRLVQELRELGRNFSRTRFGGLRTRGWLARWQAALLEHGARDAQGRFKLTFEVIYGHALKPVARPRVKAHSEIALDDMRQMLSQRRSSDA